MKRIVMIILCVALLPFFAFGQGKNRNEIRVFFLGGQSNMDGYGYVKDLPDSFKTRSNVWIFQGNSAADGDSSGGLGFWEKLKPGHGVGFTSDGKKNHYSDRFGVELAFAKRLQKLYPGEKIALIKYSRGGTSIDSMAAGYFGCWEPDFEGENGINQYDHFLRTVHQALSVKDIDKDGREDILIPSGIVWMQGEADASFNEKIANRYYQNLKRLMDLIRASLHTDDLPVVIGKISDSWNDSDGKVWNYGELVQYAEEKYARTDTNAMIVRTTRYYYYSDPWHYDSNGYLDLGVRFADSIYQLLEKKISKNAAEKKINVRY